jgi:hypothetical protein
VTTSVAVINVNLGKDMIIGAVDSGGKFASCVNDTGIYRLSGRTGAPWQCTLQERNINMQLVAAF